MVGLVDDQLEKLQDITIVNSKELLVDQLCIQLSQTKRVRHNMETKLVEKPFLGGSDDTRLQMFCSEEEFWKMSPFNRFKQLWMSIDHDIWNRLPPEDQKTWSGLLPVAAASLSLVLMILIIILVDVWLG